jgi:signal transduction histidine kinase
MRSEKVVASMASERKNLPRWIADQLAAALASSLPAAGARLSDDETSIQVLRAAASISIVFLIVYLVYDVWSREGGTRFGAIFHWITVAGSLAFFIATWTRSFREHWKHWTLLFAILLISVFILISSETQEGESRYITILLFPVATAAFVNWEWQWQVMMGLACLVLFAVAGFVIPVPGDSFHRWLGLFAAIALAECISFFIGVYRQRIDAQVDQLKQAAAFREAQIATMAHDIRSPVAAIAGFVELLDDDELEEEDRSAILARIGTTAWLMDLTVSNVLDLYQISGGRISTNPSRVDPNRVIAEAASNCAPQAIHKGLTLTVDYGEVPRGNFDPRHLERIARNLLAFSIARLSAGTIHLQTLPGNNGIIIEVEDDGPLPSDEELATLMGLGQTNGYRPANNMLGLYVARALAENSGGRMRATLPNEDRLRLVAEVPSARIEAKSEPKPPPT